MKNIRIHKDTVSKDSTTLPTYKAIMTKKQKGNILPSLSQSSFSISDSVGYSSDKPPAIPPDKLSGISLDGSPIQQSERGKRKKRRPRKVDVNVMIIKL